MINTKEVEGHPLGHQIIDLFSRSSLSPHECIGVVINLLTSSIMGACGVKRSNELNSLISDYINACPTTEQST